MAGECHAGGPDDLLDRFERCAWWHGHCIFETANGLGIFGPRKGLNMHLDPGGLIAWLVVGLVAGWLAGQFMRGGGYGLVGDIVLGIIGAFVGGFLFSLIMPGASVGLIGSIVVAFIGAIILVALSRAFTGRRAAV